MPMHSKDNVQRVQCEPISTHTKSTHSKITTPYYDFFVEPSDNVVIQYISSQLEGQ